MFNPVRRNRNIGTPKRGHGEDNRLVIPDPTNASRRWTEQLGRHERLQRVVNSRELIFLVEETSGGCVHACSIADVVQIFRHIPLPDWEGLDTVVFRQSTRKQRILRPAWGRLLYYADLGAPGRAAKRKGPALILEAVDCSASFKWRTSLDPDDQAELERLRLDGHLIERAGSTFVVTTSLEATRTTQLYRTVLHEVGHWVDWLEKVERPEASGGDFRLLSEAYFQRPSAEREAFAHRYAKDILGRLKGAGLVPFDRLEP